MSKASFTKKQFLNYASELKCYIANKFSGAGDAEDIIQDAFHNFLNIESPESLENPRAFLYQTAKNLALNRIRKQSYQDGYAASKHYDDESPSPERLLHAERELEEIHKALEQLPERCRRAFIMRRIHGMPYKEIANELGVTKSSVEKYIVKAVNFLRENINDTP